MESIKSAINQVEPIRHLNILLDYAKGGSLENLFPKKFGRKLNHLEIVQLLYQAASGLN